MTQYMAKMKNFILAKVAHAIPYYPSLNQLTGSVTASILMLQLEYWFAKQNGDRFFKFIEPCEHDCYKEGDSWIEELSFGKDEFKGAFNRIGKVYTSKSQFVKAEDIFCGKLYISYYDRQKRLTYYLRNNELVDRKLEYWISEKQEKQISRKQEKPISNKNEKPICRNRKNKPVETGNSPIQRQEKPISTDGNFPFPHISVDYNSRLHSRLQQQDTEVEVVDTKLSQVVHDYENEFGTLASKTIIDMLASYLEDGFEVALLQKAFSETILAGAKNFKYTKAILDSCIANNCLTLREFELAQQEFKSNKLKQKTTQKNKQQNRKTDKFNNIISHNWDFNELERLEQEYIENKLQGDKPSE